jgi:hypothetical protein
LPVPRQILPAPSSRLSWPAYGRIWFPSPSLHLMLGGDAKRLGVSRGRLDGSHAPSEWAIPSLSHARGDTIPKT